MIALAALAALFFALGFAIGRAARISGLERDVAAYRARMDQLIEQAKDEIAVMQEWR